MNRVGENVVSVEEYNAASVDYENFTATGLTLVGTMHYSFNSDGEQFRKKYVAADGSEQKYVFEFRDEQNVAVQLPTGAVSHAKTDHLGRKVFDEIQLGTGLMHRTFTYHEGKVTDAHKENGKQVSEPTTTLVKEIQFHDGRTIAYEYDAEERITKVTDSVGGVTVYTYDALGQLLTETVDGKVINTMTYDGYGNIKTKNGVTYTYGNAKWKDLLTAYNGKAITYDANGNPTNYQGTAATWEKGRQLKTFGANSYKYNNDGIRIQKQTASEIHDYILDGSNIVKEIVSTTSRVQKYVNEYLYDLDGTVCGIKYNETAYYFYKNLQGDVIAITDANGAVVAQYTYDAWGVPTVKSDTSGCNIATLNPFRYRSYYYDTETKFYYLQSRYYNPETGRFINMDRVNFILSKSLEKITGSSQFSYCKNDVVNQHDAAGMFPVVFMALSLALGVGISTFDLSIKFYELALLNARSNRTIKFYEWFGVGACLKERLRSSAIMEKRIRSTVQQIKLRAGSLIYHGDTDFYGDGNHADLDLKYSIGGPTSFKMKVTKTSRGYFWDSRKKKYIIDVSLADRYDFDYLTKDDKGRLTQIINNTFGYYPQSWGLLTNYYWTFSCSFDRYY